MTKEMILDTIKDEKYEEYFNLFGEKVGIELFCKKRETVTKMISDNQVELMHYWYQETGYKFIPDYAVMQNFPPNEIDKFIKNSKYWSRLMKIKEFSEVYEGREVLLKLAYVYGIFSGDNNSINHLEFLLKGIPKKLSKDNYELLIWSEDRIKDAYKYNFIFPYKSEIEEYYYLKKQLEKERIISIDSNYIFKELYKSNDNEIYSLQFNYQLYPEIVSNIRNFMETWGFEIILNPFNAYQMFNDFEMLYNPDFKNFLIENIDTVLSNFEYSLYLAKIQKEFEEIRRINSNRKLTFDLAINYVKEDTYNNVNIGNERLSNIVSKTTIYSQEEFEIVQKIYNYGKIRVFSSIPRIENNLGKYSYEILKLDDPTALVIGLLTDCCQKLNDNAETCMEHSMVDANGRVFVVRDNLGHIVAQSWIWRNKGAICFDNIEIPSKVLANVEKTKGPVARYELATEIYEIYIKAAEELLKIDNLTYLNLLENNIITEKQYYGLKLNKVTVGLGYNDISDVIKKNTEYIDLTPLSPYEFNPPVKLKCDLYLKDSSTQYILVKTNDKVECNDLALEIYSDNYDIYDNQNIKKEDLLVLKSLIKVTDNLTGDLLIKENTKIIIHPNFAIIYEEKYNYNYILDIFLNTKIDNKEQQIDITDIVLLQIKLALIQILRNNKEINISKLPKNKIEIYNNLDLILNLEKTQTKILKKVLVK